MRQQFLMATALASLSAAPAFAGALIFEPEPEPMVEVAPAPAPLAPVMSWTGPYAGVHVGWGEATVEVPGPDFDDDGVTYGAQLGYDYDFGGFVAGGELSYSQLDAEPGGSEIDHVARLLARGGYSLGRTLLYAKGGGFWADIEDSEDFGWVAGAGVEYLITPSVSGRLEYLYHGKEDFDDSGADVKVQTVTLGVNFRF